MLVAGKAHPADEGGKDLIQLRGRLRARARGGRARRLPRGLRDDARATARAGRRRLAQHAAAAARGVGHVGDEGGAERRAQLLDPRRLVGRGVLARRAASRSAAAQARTRTEAEQDEADAEALYALLEEQVLPGVLRARRGRPAAALDRADAGLDRRARAALRHRADGDGVRRAALPAGARRRCDRSRAASGSAGKEARLPRGAPPPPSPRQAVTAAVLRIRSGERSRTKRLVPSVQIGRPKIRPPSRSARRGARSRRSR